MAEYGAVVTQFCKVGGMSQFVLEQLNCLPNVLTILEVG
jgi:hypothetical protein